MHHAWFVHPHAWARWELHGNAWYRVLDVILVRGSAATEKNQLKIESNFLKRGFSLETKSTSKIIEHFFSQQHSKVEISP